MSDLITGPGQVQWRNVLIGDPDLRIVLTEVRGWLDSPDMRSADADRPGRHGQFPGPLFAGGRTIEVDFGIEDATLLSTMQAAPAPSENPTEEPLTLWIGTDRPQMVQARCTKWAVPTGIDFSVGLRIGTFQFKATDPRRYSTGLHTATTGLPKPSDSGLAFPLAFPLAFGEGVQGGNIAVANGGGAAVWPVLVIDGPVTGPVITCLDDGKVIAFNPTFKILAGQQLVIDSDTRAVLLAGSTSRRDQVDTAQWFPLPAGKTVRIGFSAASFEPDARLTVQWRDAWL